jgi:hypothetical protein
MYWTGTPVLAPSVIINDFITIYRQVGGVYPNVHIDQKIDYPLQCGVVN